MDGYVSNYSYIVFCVVEGVEVFNIGEEGLSLVGVCGEGCCGEEGNEEFSAEDG